MKNKLLIFDLDGTLFDTKDVNYHAYQAAIDEAGFCQKINYNFYCDFCNGSNYKVFLPMIIKNINNDDLKRIHDIKKIKYAENLGKAKMNYALFSLIEEKRKECYIALVTSASKANTLEILSFFDVKDCFDLIITQEDVKRQKPDPEGFLKAMEDLHIKKENTTIYEDSDNGIRAAETSGANFIRIYGYN